MFLHRAMRYYRLWIYSCNLVLLVSVVAFVSTAAWIVSDFRMSLFPSIDLRHPSLLYAYLALALQGGILQAIGCVGALRMNERLLNVYWTLMLLLLFGDVVLGVVWLFRFHYLSGSLKEELRSRLNEQYGVDLEFQLLWDRLQSETECCGVEGPKDFGSSEWLQKQDSTIRKQVVPRSCCRMQQRPSFREPEPLNVSCVESDRNPALIHLPGCYEAVHRWLQHAADLLSVLGFCVIAFLKLCFLGILRYEIREMIQKIKVLRDMSESPGLLDPSGPASLLPGPAMAAKLRRQRSSTDQKQPPNGNNNEAEPSSPTKKSSSPV
ncbi:CD151 antigen-like [Stegodyphus dumicola]|uniref:CD151 antigen-like n=1 Tax=Stegodyphus dumicola TaxID=202533 RepID=UPI0015B34905|nr:CD151 antigen-like [Stegodyphus dumicola]XP_035211656.1 CD151 antigen-like [Stegodyphus dumicola]XP_035211657.1 CD151 antigen-like [Stegodyphus dumicola]